MSNTTDKKFLFYLDVCDAIRITPDHEAYNEWRQLQEEVGL